MSEIISRPREFEELKQKFKEGGFKSIHILADFDSTLTKSKINGKDVPSVISLLRDGNYISPEYREKAKRLQEKYYPIEIDPNIPPQEKKKRMYEWWTKHFELLIESGLNKTHLEQIVNSKGIEFREGALDFIDLSHQEKIPLIIISSSGIGNCLKMFLEQEGRLYENVSIITNLFEWDEKGEAVRVNEPIITVMSKDETILNKIPKIHEEIKDKKNVILLGDSLGDLGMITGFNYENLIKIGFLNKRIEESLEKYRENFDVVITDDGDFSFINKLMQDIR